MRLKRCTSLFNKMYEATKNDIQLKGGRKYVNNITNKISPI